MTFTYLITGASRSLGLEYSRQLLLSRPDTKVIAAARNPSKADGLEALKKEYPERVYLVKLDVVDKEGALEAAREVERSGFLEGGGLDALVHNAGVSEADDVPPSELTAEDVEANLSTNLYGVLNVNAAFLPLLRKGKGKQIFGLSSVCASIALWGESERPTAAYSLSKVALNMYLKKLATELAPEGFTVVMVSLVLTPINHGRGEMTVKDAAKQAIDNIFLAVSPADNGRFLRYDGTEMEW
ncbi:hypothetical protein JCM6882_007426 [Rhodosporidiobolus microsporus]